MPISYSTNFRFWSNAFAVDTVQCSQYCYTSVFSGLLYRYTLVLLAQYYFSILDTVQLASTWSTGQIVLTISRLIDMSIVIEIWNPSRFAYISCYRRVSGRLASSHTLCVIHSVCTVAHRSCGMFAAHWLHQHWANFAHQALPSSMDAFGHEVHRVMRLVGASW